MIVRRNKKGKRIRNNNFPIFLTQHRSSILCPYWFVATLIKIFSDVYACNPCLVPTFLQTHLLAQRQYLYVSHQKSINNWAKNKRLKTEPSWFWGYYRVFYLCAVTEIILCRENCKGCMLFRLNVMKTSRMLRDEGNQDTFGCLR